MYKRIISLFVITGFLIFNFGGVDGKEEKTTKENFYKEIELFTDALTIVQNEYVDEPKMKELIYGALRGMLSALDPHSQFMDPDTYNEVKIETEGKFGGLGIEITIKEGFLTIITPMDDTPAWKAGLKPQDRIVKIDGESTENITLLEAVKKLRGKPGTQIAVTIMREDEKKLLDFTITRDIIKIKSVKDAKIIKDGIGYIKVAEFQENTSEDLENALKNLEKLGMDSLILDLRNNPGGLLETAVKVADKFIGDDNVIVTIRGRSESQNLKFKSRTKGTHPDYPLVVIINGGSASASEIVAGAIQDNKRGILLGTKSFGKGSVQTVIPLKDGSALRLTTSKYFTPSGRSIHGDGIIPDIIVELRENKTEDITTGKTMDVSKEIYKQKEAEKESYDNQLLQAIELLKGIKVYKNLSRPGNHDFSLSGLYC